MKAIEIIKRLTDGWIDREQAGAVVLGDRNADEYFGTDGCKWNGRIEDDAEYFYLSFPKSEEVDTYRVMGELPNAYCERTEIGDIVALWRID